MCVRWVSLSESLCSALDIGKNTYFTNYQQQFDLYTRPIHRVIATQRSGKLTKKATHCHPIYENCARLVTQLSYTKYLQGCRKEEWGEGDHGPSDLAGIEKRAIHCRIRHRQFINSCPLQIFYPSIATEVNTLKLSKNNGSVVIWREKNVQFWNILNWIEANGLSVKRNTYSI